MCGHHRAACDFCFGVVVVKGLGTAFILAEVTMFVSAGRELFVAFFFLHRVRLTVRQFGLLCLGKCRQCEILLRTS